MAHLESESVYKQLADDRLADAKVSRVKAAVNDVIDAYIGAPGEGPVVEVSGHARNMIINAIYGIYADPNPRWPDFDKENKNKILQYMSIAISRIPSFLNDIVLEIKRSTNSNNSIKITYSDLLHKIGNVIDSVCPIKKGKSK